jgi:hypothetical protein
VLFLFSGTDPLDVVVRTPAAQPVHLVPRTAPPRMHSRLVDRWWRGYHAAVRRQRELNDQFPLISTYLTTMLSQRMGLSTPLRSRTRRDDSSESWQTLELLSGAEKLRDTSLRETMQGRGVALGVADQPVPSDIPWTPHQFPDAPAEVMVEPIAMHVPEECFYIRFGTFSNYMWFNNLTEEHGGDLGRMIAQRGHTLRINDRMQRQLSLRQNALAELLGDQVAADVAIIGHDAFLRDGAAIGIVLHAKNNLAISSDVLRQRAETLARERDRGATLETLKIAGQNVSVLSTPDNRVRSFYAVHGDFHLVTTCRQLATRFLEASAGDRPLGASAEFRHARRLMPVDRDDVWPRLRRWKSFSWPDWLPTTKARRPSPSTSS